MPRLIILLLPLLLFVHASAVAQGPTYHRGKTITPEEVKAWDTAIGPEGKELPPGRGTAREGSPVWARRCSTCHGMDGKYQWPHRAHPPSAGKAPLLAGELGVVAKRQFATTLWDYINRAMPLGEQAGSLTDSEVYAVSAYLLYLNGILGQDDVLDAKTLPQVQMPHGPRKK
jgi:cytochrome c